MALVAWPEDKNKLYYVIWKNKVTKVRLLSVACEVLTSEGGKVAVAPADLYDDPHELADAIHRDHSE